MLITQLARLSQINEIHNKPSDDEIEKNHIPFLRITG
jgi:hypothetical protein